MTNPTSRQRNIPRLCLLLLALGLFALGGRVGSVDAHPVPLSATVMEHDAHSSDPAKDPEALEHRGLCSDGCAQVSAIATAMAIPQSELASSVADAGLRVCGSDHGVVVSIAVLPLVPPPQASF